MLRAGSVRTCVAAIAVSVVGGWGCAANEVGAPKAAQPTTLESAEPTTVEQAQAQLERARAELAGPATAPTTPAADASAVSTHGTAGTTTTESAGGGAAPGPSSVGSREARCGHACGAMSSMKRAVDAICRLAGETDPRCADARRTLKDSEAKVVGCGCAAP